MKVLFDTSVLVAALIATHPQHAIARACLLENGHRDDIEACVSTHTLAELFAVLTRFLQKNISTRAAHDIIEGLRTRLTVIDLTEDDYVWVLEQLTALNLTAAVVYDALHARAALKADATTLYTFNVKDFTRLGDAVAGLVVNP